MITMSLLQICLLIVGCMLIGMGLTLVCVAAQLRMVFPEGIKKGADRDEA